MPKIHHGRSKPSVQEAVSTQTMPTPASIHWSWGDLLLIFLASVLFQVAGGFLSTAFLPTEALVTANSGLVEAGALVGSIYWLGLRRRRQNWRAIGIVSISRRWLWGAIGLGLLLALIVSLVAISVQLLLRQPLVSPQQKLFTPNGLSWVSIIGTILFAGVAVPFAEELFFRGVLYRFLRERWGVWIGAIISAAVFGAAHLDLSVGLAIGLVGLVYALVYEHTKSLWPSIIMHALNNSLRFIIFYAWLATHTKISLI